MERFNEKAMAAGRALVECSVDAAGMAIPMSSFALKFDRVEDAESFLDGFMRDRYKDDRHGRTDGHWWGSQHGMLYRYTITQLPNG